MKFFFNTCKSNPVFLPRQLTALLRTMNRRHLLSAVVTLMGTSNQDHFHKEAVVL
jgi:hypothetical protein